MGLRHATNNHVWPYHRRHLNDHRRHHPIDRTPNVVGPCRRSYRSLPRCALEPTREQRSITNGSRWVGAMEIIFLDRLTTITHQYDNCLIAGVRLQITYNIICSNEVNVLRYFN